MRKSNTGPSFSLASGEDRTKNNHKRKRSADDHREDDNHKRTKVDKQANNNNNASSKPPVQIETVDLATSEKGGNPLETTSQQNSPATVKPLLTLPAISEVAVHLDTDLQKLEQEYKQALELAKETQKNERVRLCEQMERELKEKEQEYKDLLKKWDMQVNCGICFDQFLRSQTTELKHLPCHPKAHYCLSCYCKMFKVSAYGHSYRLWVECPLCRSKWWTDVQTFNDHNGVRDGAVQTLPAQLSPFTARDVPVNNLSTIAQLFSQYRNVRQHRPRNRFVIGDDDEDQDEHSTDSGDLIDAFAHTLNESLGEHATNSNATGSSNQSSASTAAHTTARAAARSSASVNEPYRVLDFFPWESQQTPPPYVIPDTSVDSDDEDEDVLDFGSDY